MDQKRLDDRYILQAKQISKSFPGVQALESVDLDIERGKVHALMGENGAGKSTLMNILIGIHTPDSGQLFFEGRPVRFSGVHDALQAGLSMIHQELLPFPDLTVAENIFMGKEPVKFAGWIDSKEMNRQAAALLKRLGVDIPASRMMRELSISEMQMVEIAKALSNRAKLIIMDEPTSAITSREVNTLFGIINGLTREGIAIVYISHKMDEILRIADTITVMRDGRHIATRNKHQLDNDQLITLIVGRELRSVFNKIMLPLGETLLAVKGLSGEAFKDISFELRRGEIVGIAGLMGAGRTEMVNAIFGLEDIHSGEVLVKGRKVRIKSPADAIRNGIGLVSEDRKKFGLVLSGTVRHNISLSSLDRCRKSLFLHAGKETALVTEQIRSLGIKTPSANQAVNLLSGGNQQKVVLGKVLLNDPEIIILDEPTRGIDIGAKAEIYQLITRLAASGKAVLMISSELTEILGMSDRVLVVREGQIRATLSRAEATQELIMEHLMSNPNS